MPLTTLPIEYIYMHIPLYHSNTTIIMHGPKLAIIYQWMTIQAPLRVDKPKVRSAIISLEFSTQIKTHRRFNEAAGDCITINI